MEEVKIAKPVKKRERFESVLLGEKWLTPTVKEFTFWAPGGFSFYAGQYMNLSFKVAGKVVARPYSISSPPGMALLGSMGSMGETGEAVETEVMGARDKNVNITEMSDSDSGAMGASGESDKLGESDGSSKLGESGKAGGQLCFTVKKVVGGGVTSELFDFKVGQKVKMHGPFGKFLITEQLPQRDVVMIGTGTGLSPLKSMIEYLLVERGFTGNVTLIMGVRYEKELLYGDVWEAYRRKYSYFEVLATVTRPERAGYQGLRGRVNEIIAGNIERYRGRQFYCCGLKAMVDGVEEYLLGEGIEAGRIFYEKYDA